MTTQIAKPSATQQLDHLKQISQQVLDLAKQKGATAAEVAVSNSSGFSVQVRLGEVETLEHHHDQGIGITVYFGQKKGMSSVSTMEPSALDAAVEAACHIAKFTSEDVAAGLPEADQLAYQYPDLDLYHPWPITPKQAIDLAIDCETQGRNRDKRITNSEGAGFSSYEGFVALANSLGFCGAYPASSYYLNLTLIAQEGSQMQRDYGFTVARDPQDLKSAKWVADEAAERTLARLSARKLTTRKAPVIFSARLAGGIIGSFLSAISGGNLYRKSSFLLDSLGKQVFAPWVNLIEEPHLKKGNSSAPFDGEGVKTTRHAIVEDGLVKSYLLSSYSGRKLGMKSTGNSGGAHNIIVSTQNLDQTELLQKMGTGLLVTEVMGQGVNIVTGDYSRGASGFWVENGIIQYPVEEITIAGNLKDMFLNLVAIGNDIEQRGSIHTGSMLLESMMIAGE